MAGGIIFAVACLAMVLSSSTAQVIHLGKCPPVNVRKNFLAPFYLGKWYEVQRFPSLFEADTTCSTAEYTALGGNHMKINNTATNAFRKTTWAAGEAHPPDALQPAKLIVTSPHFPTPVPYWILDTDYEDYAVVYSCSSVGFIRTEFAWVLSRKPTLEQKYEDLANAVFVSNKIDVKLLENVSHSNCVNH